MESEKAEGQTGRKKRLEICCGWHDDLVIREGRQQAVHDLTKKHLEETEPIIQ